MFTGIVEEIGRVEALEENQGAWSLTVSGVIAARGANIGDSIAVNGVCLTLTHQGKGRLTFGLAPETLSRTNLGDLRQGDGVNLERALLADGRIGGHFVQGHVDGTGVLLEMIEDGDSLRISVETPPAILHYMVPKGFIAVDGASLTVIDVLSDRFTFMLVAHSREHLVLPGRQPGERLNIEVDMLAKYAEKFMAGR